MPKTKKLKKIKVSDSSGIGMKPSKVYQFTPLNVENEVKQKKIVKESDVFELPKKKSSY